MFSINLSCELILVQQKVLHYKDWRNISLNPITSFAIKRLTPTDGLWCCTGPGWDAVNLVVCFGFATKTVLIIHWHFGCCWAVLAQCPGFLSRSAPAPFGEVAFAWRPAGHPSACGKWWVIAFALHVLAFFFNSSSLITVLSSPTNILAFVALPLPSDGEGWASGRVGLSCWLWSTYHRWSPPVIDKNCK